MSDMDLTLNKYHNRLHAMRKRPILNRVQIRRLRTKISALEEAGRDILNTTITNARSTGSSIDKNSYATYSKQVEQAYKMYENTCEYGGEILSSVADMRVAFIAGEGISFATKNEKKAEFLNDFFEDSSLNGSKLLAAVLMGELEGKVLFVLSPDMQEKSIKVRLFSWYANRYIVTRNSDDYEKIEKITYRKSQSATEETSIDLANSVYIKIGGCNYRNDEAPTRIGKILTQCENASRATYDLRKNTHIFGKIMPRWETQNAADAKVINAAVNSKSFEIGDGYAGPAKFSLAEPTGEAAEAIIKDLLCSLRYISSMTGVPIHWLAWPELMSNRATAENFLETVSAATKKERLIWQEGITGLLNKVMHIAVDSGIAEREILDGDLAIKLPLISIAALQQMADVWIPIYQEGLISKFTMQNMLPGIDPQKENELIAEEREENAKNSPFANMIVPDSNVDPDESNKEDSYAG